MSDTYEITLPHPGAGRVDMKAKVATAEQEAIKALGGPVVRSHRFSKDGTECTFIWMRDGRN